MNIIANNGTLVVHRQQLGSAHSRGRTRLDNRPETRKQFVLCEEKKCLNSLTLQSYLSPSHCAVAFSAHLEVMPKKINAIVAVDFQLDNLDKRSKAAKLLNRCPEKVQWFQGVWLRWPRGPFTQLKTVMQET